ncbi:phosphate acetyltransferase [Campylobacter sp. FMV-PI01]|uniref:Phosphate acetyltransferase n=1 Tax=Campylobacter portucalensis TaxID=2608384 RepID=A0A6L5WIC9_9BACT|nr:phosphate acetyltransferase [Campylobacter portucalensis]MSN96804.1 phosphate acetyltransferase [Campylobacter portucalensis]
MSAKSLYFVTDKKLSEFENLKKALIKEFQNLIIFTPIRLENLDENSCFSQKEFDGMIAKNMIKEAKKTIIDKFESFKNSFVLVVANSLNFKLANDLNSPVLGHFLNDIEGILFTKQCEFLNLNSIGFLNKNLSNFQDIMLKLKSFNKKIITPIKFENMLFKMASKKIQNIVLPESEDERILKASEILLKSGAVNLTLLGNKDEILNNASNLGLNLEKANFINPLNSDLLDEFSNTFYELRKNKGVSLEEAKNIVKDRNYFANMLVFTNRASGVVSGAVGTTADTVRPALQIIKTKPNVNSVSGAFFMCLEDRVCIFADCAIIPNPYPKDLANIAKSSVEMARAFGFNPLVAMLSYSTGNSGSGDSVEKIQEAINLAKDELGDIIDGPLQFDAAVDKIVASKKMPNSKVAGEANVFIFPDLNSGNIAYKAVQRLSGAVAIGPILQGLKKPVNDLSRGCLVEDIINTVLISAIQVGE